MPADPALEQRAVAALFVALLSLAGLLGLNDWSRGVYVVLFALAAGGVALWLGATSLTRAGKTRVARPRGAVVAVVIGSIGVMISAVLLVTFAVLGHQLAQYGQCLSGANTVQTQQACYTHFNHTVVQEISVLQAGSHP